MTLWRVLRVAGAVTLLPWGLSGCGNAQPTEQTSSARPVKTLTVAASAGVATRSFPAQVHASRRAELAFRVNGTVRELPFKEGDTVKTGQRLARLDPTDYELTLKDRQVQFEAASRNFGRAQELIGKGAISKVDYDRMEAQFQSTEAAYQQARQNVAYTELTAPFAGQVARRHVERFEEVNAKQTIVTLQDASELDVRINVPEALIRTLRPGPRAERPAVTAIAQFEGSDKRYSLAYKEIATTADAQTQTFAVTFTMPRPADVTILSGMTATVTIDLSGLTDAPEVHWVPATAVVSNTDMTPKVWVIDPETLAVSGRDVSLGRLDGERIEVLDGLEGGERIVAVGAGYLADGMKVAPLPESEQAESRADEPA